MSLLNSRIRSLRRRADSLPKEIEQWLSYAEAGRQFERNFSQLQALDLFMKQICRRLEQAVAKLTQLAHLTPSNTADILNQAHSVQDGIVKAHYIWSYFRSKLEQRFVPQFAHALFVADVIAYDCYQTVRNNADNLEIKHKLGLRDYPLTYLLEDFSPVTWPRTVKLARLDHRTLPLPIIGVPWDHISNPWELLSLHHEVSHDIDADLNEPVQELAICLGKQLSTTGNQQSRTSVWLRWLDEIFADFLGILLAGPPFVSFLASFMTLPAKSVCSFVPNDPHPTPYLRTLLNGQFVRGLSLGSDAEAYIDRLLSQWQTTYGKPSQELAPYISDFGDIIELILSTKLQAFKGQNGTLHSLAELASFDDNDYRTQADACDHLLSNREVGQNIPIRHLIGAAYIAVERHALDDKFASEVLERMNKAIEAQAPKGQLALRTKQSRQLLEDLANAYFDNASGLSGGLYG